MTATAVRPPIHGGGTPRQDHVPTQAGLCPTHGAIEFRIHLNGRRPNGSQKYKRRCPDCHADRERTRRDETR